MKKTVKIFSVIFILIVISSCKKKPDAPSLTTKTITEITTISAISGGEISDDGGASIISKGVCWNISDKPTIADFKTTDGSGSGSFISNITLLIPSTTYFVRTYATNSVGISYGSTVSFKTLGDKPAPVSANATDILTTSATLNGTVNPNSLSTTVSFEYGLTTTYGNTSTAVQSPLNGSVINNVTTALTGLNPGKVYHFRIKAENALGVRLSDDLLFTTLGPVTDVDGNVYQVVTIGTQVWMSENLSTTKYNNGSDIPLVSDPIDWSNLTTAGYCWYDNNKVANKAINGALYNFYTVNTGRLCPTGWHVPTSDEWAVLINYLTANGYGYEGSGDDIAKSLSSAMYWQYFSTPGVVGNNQISNNTSGFSATPSGGRSGSDGIFTGIGSSAVFWTSTPIGLNTAIGKAISYID
jgi:uncharacterized protein (TIGR02145 family)